LTKEGAVCARLRCRYGLVDWHQTIAQLKSTWFMGVKGLVIYNDLENSKTSQPGPGAAQKKFNENKSPIWTFFV